MSDTDDDLEEGIRDMIGGRASVALMRITIARVKKWKERGAEAAWEAFCWAVSKLTLEGLERGLDRMEQEINDRILNG